MTNPTSDRVLALTGARSVREAVQTKADVLAALAEPGDVLLDCAGVTQADLSFIQIIIAAHRSAGALGKRLALVASPVSALLQALQRGGFAHPDATDPACWTGHEATP